MSRSRPGRLTLKRAQEILAIRQMQVDFGIDGEFGQGHLPFVGGMADRALETGRPAGCKELFGIGADARGAGERVSYVMRAGKFVQSINLATDCMNANLSALLHDVGVFE